LNDLSVVQNYPESKCDLAQMNSNSTLVDPTFCLAVLTSNLPSSMSDAVGRSLTLLEYLKIMALDEIFSHAQAYVLSLHINYRLKTEFPSKRWYELCSYMKNSRYSSFVPVYTGSVVPIVANEIEKFAHELRV
jgi:hypothetical protein